MKTETCPLSEDQLSLLWSIRAGANIFHRPEAIHLRAMEDTHGDLFRITPPRLGLRSPKGKRPYFGAILTEAGKELLINELQAS